MKRKALALFGSFVVIFFLCGNASAFVNDQLSLQGSYVPGELLVKYRSPSSAQLMRAQIGAETIRHFEHLNVEHLKLPSNLSVEEALKIFNADPSVEYAEPNYLYYLTSTTPNDSFFPWQWSLHNTGQAVNGISGTAGADIHAPEAWDITTGSATVVVAVIDTGVDYNHPDLRNNISNLGYNFVNNNNSPIDSYPIGHGTHVSGTIAAVGNNGVGIAGVSWNTKIMPLKAGDALGQLATSDIISAIAYARNNGAKIINASFGGPSYSQATYDAINNARNAGILFVAAAGNETANNDTTPSYPASYNLDNIIAVAATDQNDNLASFSNYGATTVHVAAPGTNIYSTKPARRTVWSDNFDSGNISGWTTGGTNNTWGLSSSQHYSGSYSLAVNPSGNYLNNSNSWARAPILNLSSSVGSALIFQLTGTSEAGFDFLYVETSSDGSTWTNQTLSLVDLEQWFPNGISGSGSSWYRCAVDLGAYDGQAAVYFRFRFYSDASVTYSGFYIDDVSVTAASTSYVGMEYQYLAGTSMAAPHVSGLAALIWGYSPSLTYAQVKSTILGSVDTKSSLAGKVVSNGRVNALNALNLVINQATLSSISVTPANLSIPAAGTRQFAAMGTYSDQTSHDITTQVIWGSSDTSVATVSSGGLVTSVAVGTTTITATSGSIVGSTTLTVTSYSNAVADILWRQPGTGEVVVWHMNGVNIASSASVGTVPPPWQIEGVGDFNGDGNPDILWRQAGTGEIVVWYMNGATITSSASVRTVPPPWQIEGVGDFNNDGKPDILWRQAGNGEVVVWYMNGATITSSASVGTVPAPWQIEGVGDFNNDGNPDILWRQAGTGEIVVWYMNGATITSSAFVGTVPLPWQIVATRDFNSDGKPDILWRSPMTGENVVWYMNGVTITSSASVATVPPPWQIVGR